MRSYPQIVKLSREWCSWVIFRNGCREVVRKVPREYIIRKVYRGVKRVEKDIDFYLTDAGSLYNTKSVSKS